MITCETFRAQFSTATDDASLLEHVRSCDGCLSIAAETDPDIVFRSIGGEMMPPGGLDAFVNDVMREVRLRSTEKMSHHRQPAWRRRLAIAATVAAGITGAALFYERDGGVTAPAIVMAPKTAAVRTATLINRPIVEEYDSASATIVEVPTESSADFKVVMIFDQELPADL
jgi:hypothetical protein